MTDSKKPAGCLLFFLEFFRETFGKGASSVENGPSSVGGDTPPVEYPYQRKDCLLTNAERAFFSVLEGAVAAEYRIFAMVRLADLIFVRGGTERRQSADNRIRSKHIDFVLCSRDVVRPLLAVELDDSSHKQKKRQERDAFLDSALAAAGLPILHVPVRSGYDAAKLAEAIRRKIGA